MSNICKTIMHSTSTENLAIYFVKYDNFIETMYIQFFFVNNLTQNLTNINEDILSVYLNIFNKIDLFRPF